MSSSLIAAAATAAALMAAFVWTRPPFYLREFGQGMAYQHSSNYQEATACFVRSFEAQPDFGEALYQRARTEMLSGSYATAIKSFKQLSTAFNDRRGVAYAGYCFNLTQEHTLAIDLYEHALELGFESVGLHNNLAVSYELARSKTDDHERLAAAQRHLQKALAIAPQSLMVRRNLVKLAILQSTNDASFSPATAIEHVEFITRACPDDAEASTYAAYLYGSLSKGSEEYCEKCMDAIRNAFRTGGGPTETDLKLNSAFATLKVRPEFAQLCDAANHVVRVRRNAPERTFVDPVEPSDDAVAHHD
jgi:tetratricopeptide (TPR) repeat protein